MDESNNEERWERYRTGKQQWIKAHELKYTPCKFRKVVVIYSTVVIVGFLIFAAWWLK